jgi:hypothetical protein
MKMEYSVFKVEENKMAAEMFWHGQVYINLGNVFAECVHISFQE